MAYNFLGLVNDICDKVNEVNLTESNFATATGFYSDAKNAVNFAIDEINQHGYHWPFNHVEQHDVLTAGVNRYEIPYDAKSVDFYNFRIKRDDTLGNETRRLNLIDYEQYVSFYIDDEYNTNTSVRGIPLRVAETPSNEYVIHPVPDKAYTLIYEYYLNPVSLELATDIPTVPETYRHVIFAGAMYYVYNYRSDHENSQFMYGKFQEGIKNMRKVSKTRMEYVRDTRVERRK